MTEGFGRSFGRYRLDRLVGRGGMAEVWEARDRTFGRRVAVKIILPALAGDPLLWSGDSRAAISWYKKVATTRDRTEIGTMLRTLSQEGGPELISRACDEGFAPACDPQQPAQALRGRRTRTQP
jgi:serine/threonine protein kinase